MLRMNKWILYPILTILQTNIWENIIYKKHVLNVLKVVVEVEMINMAQLLVQNDF
jgi:hypothetical protein